MVFYYIKTTVIISLALLISYSGNGNNPLNMLYIITTT